MGYFLAAVTAASLIYGACSGSLPAVSAAALGECSHAATLSLELLGTICLWSGVSAVADECGLTAWTARALAPALGLLFPTARRDEKVMKAISMNVTANLLGLGNAATPLGIKAMRELRRAGGGLSAATKDMALFVVVNTASLQILPTTVAALRLGEGSPAPMDILPAVWLTGGFSLLAGILAAKVFCRETGPRARDGVHDRETPQDGGPVNPHRRGGAPSGNRRGSPAPAPPRAKSGGCRSGPAAARLREAEP